MIIGHVDHGKTSLLDYIRKSRVAEKEAGGITQSIGAYEVEHNGQKITFIDTPGHEAFMQMRARGAQLADLAVLVVAADDSVQEQTKEAIAVAQQTETPFVVAITKIDRVGETEITKVKNDLMQLGVLLEGYGGNISWQGVSSKTGEGVKELLDLILLAADLEDLQFEPANPGHGSIIESKVDSRRGILVTAIIIDGVLKMGDKIGCDGAQAKVRNLENFLGQKIEEAEPSSPVLIIGFKEVPEVGSEFVVGGAIEYGKIADIKKPELIKKTTDGQTAVNIMLKADSAGSLEALSQVIKNLPTPPGYQLDVSDEGIGDITDGDVKWNPNVIIGFRVKTSRPAENLAKSNKVQIITSDIIYELIKNLEEWLKGFGVETISGDLEILAIFGKKAGRQIVGGKIVSGEARNNTAVEIQRASTNLGVARILNLQQAKQNVQKVEVDNECGLLVESDEEIRVGDHLIFK